MIEPADNLHAVEPIGFGNLRKHCVYYTAVAQKEVGEEEFGVVGYFLEEERQNAVKGVALGDEQVFKKLFIVARRFQSEDFLLVKPLKFD